MEEVCITLLLPASSISIPEADTIDESKSSPAIGGNLFAAVGTIVRWGVPRREVGLLLPNLVLLAVMGGEFPDGRGVILRLVRLGAGDGENVAILL